jgi:VIT1/CCC1 family predicted Fe2+/Mn2+ transporter
LAIFILVVLSTFPVVLPFVLMDDVAAAKYASQAIALLMLFLGGFALGRYAGYGAWRAAFAMTALGVLLVGAILALGG